jgi:hypothetical protein
MGMGKKSAPKAPPPAPVAAPTVETKTTVDSQAAKNANAQARVEENQSATLLQTKDDELLKKQQVGVA